MENTIEFSIDELADEILVPATTIGRWIVRGLVPVRRIHRLTIIGREGVAAAVRLAQARSLLLWPGTDMNQPASTKVNTLRARSTGFPQNQKRFGYRCRRLVTADPVRAEQAIATLESTWPCSSPHDESIAPNSRTSQEPPFSSLDGVPRFLGLGLRPARRRHVTSPAEPSIQRAVRLVAGGWT